MKTLFSAVIACVIGLAANAQTADLEVSYSSFNPGATDGTAPLKHQYILLANANESKFYSPRTEYIDSMVSTPDGQQKYMRTLMNSFMGGKLNDAPKPDGSYYVFKSFKDNKLKYYDSAWVERYFYEETPEEWNWEIGDSTKVILGYECIKATTDYHGRKWTAWFSPEIPVQNGPWKLDGLPGLILEAQSEGDPYTFIATGIQQCSKPIKPIYLEDSYEKFSRKAYLKAKRSFVDNPMGKISAQFGVPKMDLNSGMGAALKSFFPQPTKADFLETDYH